MGGSEQKWVRGVGESRESRGRVGGVVGRGERVGGVGEWGEQAGGGGGGCRGPTV